MATPTHNKMLHIVVVVGVFILIYCDKLQGQAAIGLIVMIVRYLFGRRK